MSSHISSARAVIVTFLSSLILLYISVQLSCSNIYEVFAESGKLVIKEQNNRALCYVNYHNNDVFWRNILRNGMKHHQN